MSQDDTPDLATRQAGKVAPEAVALRAQPRPVTRLNRRTLAILVGGLRRVQREVRTRKPALHHLDVMHRHADFGRDHLAQLVLVQHLAALRCLAFQFGLDPAQVEEQRLLAGRRPGPHH